MPHFSPALEGPTNENAEPPIAQKECLQNVNLPTWHSVILSYSGPVSSRDNPHVLASIRKVDGTAKCNIRNVFGSSMNCEAKNVTFI